MPLTLTLLASVVEPARRGLAFGIWSATAGLGVALGPVIGGAITEYSSWQWIFWVNVPIGVLLLPVLALVRESRGGAGRLDPLGTILATIGLFGVVFGVVRGNQHGWTSGQVLAALIGGALVLLAFLCWERRAPAPMVPLNLFRSRGFALTNVIALLMAFGMFGAVFLSAQFLQTVQGYSPLEAGIRTLPWTAVPAFAAPLGGILSDRVGARRILAIGLFLQAAGIAWLAVVSRPDVAYLALVPAFVLAGWGMGFFFAPIARLTIDFVPVALQGVASGTSNALRQLGTVLGVAVLGAIFSSVGGYASGQSFVDGMRAAQYAGAAVLAVAAVIALFLPASRPAPAPTAAATPAAPSPALSTLSAR
jgi:EmrB/QacA subfamily drug resistance transporter